MELETEKLDNVFIPNKLLNDFRRSVFDSAYLAFTKKAKHNLKKITIKSSLDVEPFKDFEIINDLDQQFNDKNIIYSPEIYNLENVRKFKEKCHDENKNAFLDLPNFALEKDIEILKDIIKETNIMIVANNYYALNLTDNYVIGAGLNVYNMMTANFLGKSFITAESNLGELTQYPYMTLRHCPMKSHFGATCDKCPYKDGYVYKMDNGKVLKLKRKKMSSCTFYLV